MKIELNTPNGEKKTIDMQYPSKEQVNKLWEKLRELEKSDKKVYVKNFHELFKFRDQVAIELSGLKEEEFMKLRVNETDKLTGFVAEQAFGDLNFTWLFKKQQG